MLSLSNRSSNITPRICQALNCPVVLRSSLASSTTKSALTALKWSEGKSHLYSSRGYREIVMHFGAKDNPTPEEIEEQKRERTIKKDLVDKFILYRIEQINAKKAANITPMSQEEFIKTYLGSYEEYSKNFLELTQKRDPEKAKEYIENPKKLPELFERLSTKGYERYKKSLTRPDIYGLL